LAKIYFLEMIVNVQFFKLQVFGCRMMEKGCKLKVAGYRCKLQVAGYRLQVTGCGFHKNENPN